MVNIKFNMRVEIYEEVDGKLIPIPDQPAEEQMCRHGYNIDECIRVSNFLQPYENAMVNNIVSAYRADYRDIDMRIFYLQRGIEAYQELKRICEKAGEHHNKYFYDAWEHSASPYQPGKRYIEDKENDLRRLKRHYTLLKQCGEYLLDIIDYLPDEIDEPIRKTPGILQTALYKQFDADIKNEIQSVLRHAEKRGYVYREKKGSTYELYLP